MSERTVRVKMKTVLEAGGKEYRYGEEYDVQPTVAVNWANNDLAELVSQPVEDTRERIPAKKAAVRRRRKPAAEAE